MDQTGQIEGVRQVAEMQEHAAVFGMDILVEMVDPAGVVGGSAAFDAVDFITFFQQQFGQVGTVLTSDSCDKSFFHVVSFWFVCYACVNLHFRKGE